MNIYRKIAPVLLGLIIFPVAGCKDDPPGINRIEPAFGLTHGDEKVVIQGNNIEALMPVSVYFGNQRVYLYQLHTSDELWITSPASDTAQTDGSSTIILP